MRTQRFIVAAVLGTATAFTAVTLAPTVARAQSTTTGAIQGVVKEKGTGAPLAGVTVVATGAQGSPSALTDDQGFYKIDNLTPGDYVLTFYYATVTVQQKVNVGVNKVVPGYVTIDTNDAGETVQITGTAPTIDPTSTTQGITLDQEYTRNIPVPGRTFESVLGAAAGSQGDGVGISFSGSSSLENQYNVDGNNTTGLTLGTVGSPILNEFIQEIEVITGGYDAEYGRATGGVVNVVTKSGSNEIKGSVFAVLTPGALTAAVQRAPTNSTAIEATPNQAYNFDFGFDIGGPIIKDKVWYYVGFAPTYVKYDWTRRVLSRTDCRKVLPDGSLSPCMVNDPTYHDHVPDVDPKTGFYITDEIDRRITSDTSAAYQIIGKVNFAVSPEHQGQVSAIIQPGSNRFSGGEQGLPQSTNGETSGLVSDISGKWSSKFNDNKTEVEAVVGWHRSSFKYDLVDATTSNLPAQALVGGTLGDYAGFGGEAASVAQRCSDGKNDPYPGMTNCPDLNGYSVGGAGALADDVEQRVSGRVGVIERIKAAGTHEIKGGLDTEENYISKERLYSGGSAITNFVNSQVELFRWVQLQPMGDTDPRFDNTCRTPSNGAIGPGGNTQSFTCDFLKGTPGYPGTLIEGNTMNWAAYLRDSWQIMPNLTLNYGLRYEEQRLRYAKNIQNTPDPVTNDIRGTNAMVLTGMFAPRIGVLYDWTKEGRSKIYGHWGRFYESIPMDINDRSFGGEVSYRQILAPSACGMTDPRIGGPNGMGCANNENLSGTDQLYGAGGTLVSPNIKAQYMDEILLGVEYEILEDLKLGISYQNRKLGRVIEDVSTDGARTYVIANPGEISDGDLSSLETRIMNTDDPTQKARLQNQLNLFKGIRVFDPPTRDYNALQFTVTRRMSKNLYIQASYTYSRTMGNYPGLISYDNGQLDPNISSQYDLIELLSNRYGALPQDRPHYIKIDGYYTFDLKKAGFLTVGTRIRALSGTPRNTLAGHYLYGANESFLLPRGEIGRTDFEHGIDLHVSYGRNLGRGVKMEIFANLFNLYNRQGQAATDDGYGLYVQQNNANPIVGGTYQDLVWVRRVDQNGSDTGQPLWRNPNYGNTVSRYAPLSVQFGMRVTF